MNPTFRVSLLAGLALSLAVASGCTVRPLMATPDVTPGGLASSPALSSIAIAPVDTRYAQEVRNHLIFLLNGGAGQPASARYTLDLAVTRTSSAAARVQVRTDNEPTSSLLTMTARYTLKDSGTGQVVANGQRQISSAYDVPRQEFASLRAERDAENRAARELAEQLRLALGQDLARSGNGS
ncbi:LPS assembly lipoprotein LptE [Nitratireductor kimnyeongensis]|uniref:LPS assembly lipoprotein LptE n=1 Tax=Nitratireductor kimnyeongensis TaxID=430679 RepID=A0ABW0TCD5_9HYPH|nr:LPS assembly lipoprotein LptE [Nitratireductor kimnyeongensis]